MCLFFHLFNSSVGFQSHCEAGKSEVDSCFKIENEYKSQFLVETKSQQTIANVPKLAHG